MLHHKALAPLKPQRKANDLSSKSCCSKEVQRKLSRKKVSVVHQQVYVASILKCDMTHINPERKNNEQNKIQSSGNTTISNATLAGPSLTSLAAALN